MMPRREHALRTTVTAVGAAQWDIRLAHRLVLAGLTAVWFAAWVYMGAAPVAALHDCTGFLRCALFTVVLTFWGAGVALGGWIGWFLFSCGERIVLERGVLAIRVRWWSASSFTCRAAEITGLTVIRAASDVRGTPATVEIVAVGATFRCGRFLNESGASRLCAELRASLHDTSAGAVGVRPPR
jgi:hypothetical protein